MRPLLFIDFDGTICHDHFWRSLEATKQPLIQEFFVTERGGLVSNWMRGKYSSEEINAYLAKKIGVPYDLLWKTFQTDCQTMNVTTGVLEKIAQLRKKFTVILATDNMDCFSRFTVPALGLQNHFDDIINSADVGICKDDDAGRFFRNIAEKYDLPIEQSIAIDDSRKTCQTVADLGGKRCLVTGEFSTNHWLKNILLTQ